LPRSAASGTMGLPHAGTGAVAKETTTRTRSLAAVVLAAGKGKRLRSARPKVLHPICGQPALWHVLRLASAAKPDRIVIVVGHGAEDVRGAVEAWDISPKPVFVEQAEQLGTGHAVLQARRAVGRVDDVLVANGDFDPVLPKDVRRILQRHRRSGAAATIGSAELDEPGDFGRVVREGSRVVDVVEGLDASAETRRINEVATNWIAFRRDALFRVLPKVGRNNRQHEYYLNRAISILIAKGEPVVAVLCDTGGTLGLNSRRGLADVARVVRERINAEHMASGVTLLDPDATYIDVGVRIGRDTTVAPNVFLEGDTVIGRSCSLGPSVRIADSAVGDRSSVQFAVVLGSTIGRDVDVGPFVRMRPGVVMDDGSKAGAFVDLKAARVGRGSKVPHLSYVGDADIGEDVNVGAGTITINYDGYGKHRTVIEDGARIGSDTMLIAPVRVGRDANTGAGSVITKDVPPGALAVERSEQKIVRGYRDRKDAEHRKGRR
jgi:bifunctional UDP-N-acetylglucosamine pyrophosphorylase / glucosamine-1-phosphate N-acetyltransferase